MYSFSRLGSSLHLVRWIPGVYSFSRLGSLECILLVGLDPWGLLFGSLECLFSAAGEAAVGYNKLGQLCSQGSLHWAAALPRKFV